jgi:uncharacterized RDD family membrane protein YckC
MPFIKPYPNARKRVVATLIDYVVIGAFFMWFVMTFGEPNDEGGKTVSGTPALIPLAFWFVWLVLIEAFCGATLGHEIVGLKVVSVDGRKISFGQALKRRLCDPIEIGWCLGFIAFIVIKSTEYKQRLGDLWAKTLIVDKKQSLNGHEFEFEMQKDEKTH